MKIRNLKKTIHALSITLALSCIISAPTFAAGPGSDGGGNSAEDAHGKRRLLDLIEEEDELEYFDFYMGKYDPILAERYPQRQVRLYDQLGLWWSITFRAANGDHVRGFGEFDKPLRWAFVDFDLKDVNDTGIIRIERPGTKKQLAIQKNGLVVVNRKEFNLLDNESKEALRFHESALYAVNQHNPGLLEEKGTAPVRTFVKRLVKFLKQNDNTYPLSAVRDAYNDFGIEKIIEEQALINKGSIPVNTKLILRNKLPSFQSDENICLESHGNTCKQVVNYKNEKKEYHDAHGPGCLFLETENNKQLLHRNSVYIVEKIYNKQIEKTGSGGSYTIIELYSKEKNQHLKMSCSRRGYVPDSREPLIFREIKEALGNYFSFETPSKSQKKSVDDSGDAASSEATTSSAE